MTKLNHAELACAQERKNWAVLWEHALPIVKGVVRRLAKNDSMETDEDLLQEGMLVAGLAMRTWRPIECALSTHIGTRVRGDLLNYAATRNSGGIGSYKQRPAVLSLGDTRDEGSSGGEQGTEDEDVDDNSFEAALTYEGVLRRYTGQVDGQGFVPDGFGDPEDEAERATTEARVAAALALLPIAQRLAIAAVFGVTGEPPITIREYATRSGVPRSSVNDLLQNALGQMQRNFRHK